jgi:KDO2-lipid IV(A) lauroyltransferase
MLVSRHLRRVLPDLEGKALDRIVDETFVSYARYWVESFRLPEMTPEQVDFGLSMEGYGHIDDALARGNGAIIVLPHLGGWEWAGFWFARVMNQPITVVVEAVEPQALFDFFADFRRNLGMNIVPLGPSAGSEILKALRANHVVCLLSDRDINGDGIELEFFGEVTTLPAGPATLALRTGAVLIPTAIYFDGRSGHLGLMQEPVIAERRGRLRADIERVTVELAGRLEQLIRRAPEQWHMQQPNWPSDFDALDAIGKPHPRPEHGPSSLARMRVPETI